MSKDHFIGEVVKRDKPTQLQDDFLMNILEFLVEETGLFTNFILPLQEKYESANRNNNITHFPKKSSDLLLPLR